MDILSQNILDLQKFQHSFDQALKEATLFEEQRLNDFVESYFGSFERAQQIAKYYVIEETPMRMEVDQRIQDPYAIFRMTHEYRIRPKTPEELAHDRADEIIEKNTRKVCIVCQNPVNSDDLEDTIHGPYHTWCLDGKP